MPASMINTNETAVDLVAARLISGAWFPSEYEGNPSMIEQWAARCAGALLADVAAMTAGMCHWTQSRGNARDESHWNFHYGSPCPYEAMAAVLCGEPDPRHEVHANDVWRSSGGRRIGRTPDKITRHGCGCVTGWDDAFEECVLARCPQHSASRLEPREQPPAPSADPSVVSS
jgi:hypothetical protein